jgi:hypothetical protein
VSNNSAGNGEEEEEEGGKGSGERERERERESSGGAGTGVFRHEELDKLSVDDLKTCVFGRREGGGMDVHMFGDSRMRALSFSVMKLLDSDVDDTDENLKELVVLVYQALRC